ncbi:hypothetical protein P175DRAFT_0527847 [Aspergillus ochraceoroseus IBT 24754]|uniref:Uncharacterized protein n=1 Tax=Aspergillus ochraceoroseus IBT 24754 TaxID=1392256 RepID=A0A2T5M762_9EURO|nr:uncharacterized protein P175DRAFT_0527847 [Aspergillus ochraceoroseus IBT 24754]PTU24378.1 hypothetical protein P175DRAFT_0527847 [Aspergillus ochraceoroseus IBT 24754]
MSTPYSGCIQTLRREKHFLQDNYMKHEDMEIQIGQPALSDPERDAHRSRVMDGSSRLKVAKAHPTNQLPRRRIIAQPPTAPLQTGRILIWRSLGGCHAKHKNFPKPVPRDIERMSVISYHHHLGECIGSLLCCGKRQAGVTWWLSFIVRAQLVCRCRTGNQELSPGTGEDTGDQSSESRMVPEKQIDAIDWA